MTMPDHDGSGSDELTEARRRGIEMLRRVYGWDVSPDTGGSEFARLTYDHLMGEVWASGSLSIRERRLLLLGLLVGYGLDDVVGLQVEAALRLGEISPDELREIVVFLTHYAGWPRGAKLNGVVEDLIARASADPDPDPDGASQDG